VRDLRYFTVIGRLAPDVTLEAAQAETNVIAVRLAEANDGDAQHVEARLVPLHEELVGEVRPVLILLLGSVGLVLLIACANVANLLLARSAARTREVAVRAALGAGRSRLVRQFMTENVLLALGAGGIGLLVSIWGVEALVRLVPADVPRLSEIGVDGAVLLFTLVVSLLTGAAFGLIPALQASRPDLQASLKEGSRGAGEGRRSRRFSGLIVVAEVALSLVLLCAAGLLFKSLVRLLSVDPGFRTENLLVMRIDLPETRYPEADQRRAFFREITERVSTVPGVDSAAAALALPFSGMAATLTFEVEGRSSPGGEDLATEYQPVSPGYFRTMGIPLIKGRTFTGRDDADAPRVVVINEAMARWQWPGEDPIGRSIAVADPSDFMEIVGVVGDVRHFGLESAPRPEVYISCLQDPWPFMALVVRAKVDPLSLTGAVRDQVLAVDPEQAVYAVSTFEQVIERSTKQRRFTALLLGLFTGVALLLALVGIYGVMSNSVGQRAHEIGIRMALGARRDEVLRLVMGWGLRMVLQGTVIGLAAALVLTRFLSSMLFGISPADPIVLASVVLVLVAASALAAYLPAHRASRVDPVVALRNE
jgi:putative ABC transport system permease protein